MASNPNMKPPSDGDESRGPALLIVSIVFGLLAFISTMFRLFVRAFSRKLGWDDAMILLALLLFIAQTVLTGLAYQAGDGRHEYYLTTAQVQEVLKWNYITEILLFLIIPFTKISICLFVARIKNTGWLKWLLRALITGLIITTIVPFVILFVQCRPVSAFWDRRTGSCWDPRILNGVNYFQVAYSILSDLICSFLPIIILWRVQMRLRLKLAIWTLMSLGLVATACAIVRMSLFAGDLSTDLTWERSLISIWCCLEETLGIICANLALSRYVYQFFAESRWSRKASYRLPTSRQETALPSSTAHQTRPHTIDRSGGAQDDTVLLNDLTIRKTTDLYLTEERANGVTDDARPYLWNEAKAQSIQDRI